MTAFVAIILQDETRFHLIDSKSLQSVAETVPPILGKSMKSNLNRSLKSQ
jgi:hypothetical protein